MVRLAGVNFDICFKKIGFLLTQLLLYHKKHEINDTKRIASNVVGTIPFVSKNLHYTKSACIQRMNKTPYIPQSMPPEIKWEPLVSLLSKANRAIAQYNGYLRGIINPEVLLSPLTTQEAVQSSKIEGTRATLGEVLEYEAGDSEKSPERVADIREIINYRNASRLAVSNLKDNPITLKLIKEIHWNLMDSVRGADKARGRIRDTQNWIGAPGSDLKDATFIPPQKMELDKHLNDFENFINADFPDPLVHVGLIHAQFELLHPFLDGNGRVGRILIPLYLFKKGLLQNPVFYLSGYLEKHRDEYYSRLQGLSEGRLWNAWIEFFLNAINVQADKNSEKAEKILDLYSNVKQYVSENLHSLYAIQIVDTIFANPVFNTTTFMRLTGTKRGNAHVILKKLAAAGTINLLRAGRGQKPALYIFSDLYNIVEPV